MKKSTVTILSIATGFVAAGSVAHATATLVTLATFNYNATDPNGPGGDLLLDSAGNLYGTAGGSNDDGTVFEVPAHSGLITTIAAFNGSNGSYPGGLTFDSNGNLFGSTNMGGANSNGTIFELPVGTRALTTLVNFKQSVNGAYPGSLTMDASGNLYGTTDYGPPGTYGTVFEVAQGTHSLSTLATFNLSNGNAPGPVTVDAAGNLFGITSAGGNLTVNGGYGDGGVFKLPAGGSVPQSIVNFNGSNGSRATGKPLEDSAGDLFGVTYQGGSNSLGTLYEIIAGSGTLKMLVNFNGTNGENPDGDLLFDAAGDIFGTTYGGGIVGQSSTGVGTVFEVTAGSFSLKTLYVFKGTDGSYPTGGLTADAAGDLFGTTSRGGTNGVGTVFELTNTGFVVPEPSSLSLLPFSSIALLRRRRRLN